MLGPVGGLSPALLVHYGERRPYSWQSEDLAFSTYFPLGIRAAVISLFLTPPYPSSAKPEREAGQG